MRIGHVLKQYVSEQVSKRHEHLKPWLPKSTSATDLPKPRTTLAYFVPPTKNFAGIERVVHEIATGLATAHSDRLDVHVIFAKRYDEDLLADVPYTTHVLDVHRLRHMTSALRACVRANRVDILVVPQIEASVVSWLATRGLGLPVFVPHLHGNPHLEERDGTRRTRLAFSVFRHLISRRIQGVLAVAPSLQRYAAVEVAPHADVHFAMNPVRDLEVASPAAREAPDDGVFKLLNVGRLSRQKGQDILLRALAIARPDMPPVHLTLVGSGPEESALRRLSAELQIEDIVTFAGYCSEPAGFYRDADCFVFASRWEGFSIALLEALQFGLPLLAPDCDFGPSDLITDPRIGEIVERENPEALAEGLKRAAARGADASHASFRREVARGYGRDEAAEMHFRVLQRIATSSSASVTRLAALTSA